MRPDPDKNSNHQIDKVYGDTLNDEFDVFTLIPVSNNLKVYFIPLQIVENWRIDSLTANRKDASFVSYEGFTADTIDILDSNMVTLNRGIIVTRNAFGVGFNSRVNRNARYVCKSRHTTAGIKLRNDLILVGVNATAHTEETLVHELLHMHGLFDVNLQGNMMHWTTATLTPPYFTNKTIIECETGTGKALARPRKQRQWLDLKR